MMPYTPTASHATLTGVCDYAKDAHTSLLKEAEQALAALPENTESRWRVELLVMNLRIHTNIFAKISTEHSWQKAE